MSNFLKNDLMARRRASASYANFIKVLVETRAIKMLETRVHGRYDRWFNKRYPDTVIEDPDKAISHIGGDGVSVKFEYNGEIYTSYFADGDYVTDSDKFGPFEDFFTSFVSEMKEAGEYYIPHTTIPWWKAPVPKEDRSGKHYIPGTAIPWYKSKEDPGWFNIAKDENGKSFAVDCEGNATEVVEKAEWFVELEGKAVYSRTHNSGLYERLAGNDIDIHNRYVVIDGTTVILYDHYCDSIYRNVQNATALAWVDEKSGYDLIGKKIVFQTNDEGGKCFHIPPMSAEQRLEFYQQNGFHRAALDLSSAIEREKREKEAEEAKRRADVEKLQNFVRSKNCLLVEVVFRNGSPDGDGATIRAGENDGEIVGKYYPDDPTCQYLYGIQEKGWTGIARRGMLINVEKAKAEMKNGNLHLDVPETAMGEIIGKNGAHIKATEAALRQKGLTSLRKIILHHH